MKKILTLIAYLIFFVSAFAQSRFKQGYIIKSEGDTIKGYIDYRPHSKNTQSCFFKSNENSDATKYEPAQLIGYRFDDDAYYETTSLKDADGEALVFMEKIVQGRVNLYLYNDRFFLKKDGSDLYELKIKSEEILVDGTRMKSNTTSHLGILNYLLSDCETVAKEIPSVKLVEKKLTTLIEAYNKCISNDYEVFKKNKPWIKTEPGLVAGISNSKFRLLSNLDSYKPYTKDFPRYTHPVGGLTMRMYSPRISERFALQGDLIFQNYKFSTAYKDYMNHHKLNMEVKSLSVPVAISYTINRDFVSPFIKMGASYTHNLKSVSTYFADYENPDGEIISSTKRRPLEISRNQWGLLVGIGGEKKIYKNLLGYLEMRYEKTDGFYGSYFKPDDYTKTNLFNLQLLMGIRNL